LPREAMGFGDVKFMGAIGAFLGYKAAIFSLAVSSVLGAVVGGGLILMRRREWSSRIPYGPYIALAALIWMFGGQAAMGWWLAGGRGARSASRAARVAGLRVGDLGFRLARVQKRAGERAARGRSPRVAEPERLAGAEAPAASEGGRVLLRCHAVGEAAFLDPHEREALRADAQSRRAAPETHALATRQGSGERAVAFEVTRPSEM